MVIDILLALALTGLRPFQASPVFVPQRSLGSVACSAVDSSGHYAVTGAASGICIWDLQAAVIVAELGRTDVRSVSFVGDGGRVSISSVTGVEVWDWRTRSNATSLGGWFAIANRS